MPPPNTKRTTETPLEYEDYPEYELEHEEEEDILADELVDAVVEGIEEELAEELEEDDKIAEVKFLPAQGSNLRLQSNQQKESSSSERKTPSKSPRPWFGRPRPSFPQRSSPAQGSTQKVETQQPLDDKRTSGSTDSRRTDRPRKGTLPSRQSIVTPPSRQP